jgi:hypothetical protein
MGRRKPPRPLADSASQVMGLLPSRVAAYFVDLSSSSIASPIALPMRLNQIALPR